MTLLITMLPIYLLGNFHCIGMCGPLVMMIGQHRFRYFYFLGRILSFTLAGLLAGELGSVLNQVLSLYHLSAIASFLIGGLIFAMGLFILYGWTLPFGDRLAQALARLSRPLSLLILRDRALPTFLFGFFTVMLPCGQTVIVFSACALSGSGMVGLINGFAFSLLTTPSLLLALHAHKLLNAAKRYYAPALGWCSLFVGSLAICRGLAEISVIPHLILNPSNADHYQLVIF